MDFIDMVLSFAEEGLEKPDIKFYERVLLNSNCIAAEAVMQMPESKNHEPDYIIHSLDELINLFG